MNNSNLIRLLDKVFYKKLRRQNKMENVITTNQLKNENKPKANTLQLVCIYDKKSGLFNGISATVNNAVALRGFADECQNPKSMLNLHAEDYDLCNLGELDMQTGQITPRPLPIILGTAQQFVKVSEK